MTRNDSGRERTKQFISRNILLRIIRPSSVWPAVDPFASSLLQLVIKHCSFQFQIPQFVVHHLQIQFNSILFRVSLGVCVNLFISQLPKDLIRHPLLSSASYLIRLTLSLSISLSNQPPAHLLDNRLNTVDRSIRSQVRWTERFILWRGGNDSPVATLSRRVVKWSNFVVLPLISIGNYVSPNASTTPIIIIIGETFYRPTTSQQLQ